MHVPHRCLHVPDSCVKKEIKKQRNKDITGRWERRKGEKSKKHIETDMNLVLIDAHQ